MSKIQKSLKQHKQLLIGLLIVLIITIPVLLPLFQPGFFQSDDGEWMIIRFSAFHQAFRDGQFPVRFLGRLHHGYGYPVANFLYPGFMYLAEPFHLLGFGFVDSIKILLGITTVGSSMFSFLWLRTRFSLLSSIAGSLFYTYTPYHLYDLYKRGSVGELVALTIVPFILWQLERGSLFWQSLGIGMLLISHNTLAMLFVPFLVLYAFIHNGNKQWIQTLVPFLFGIGLAGFFWVPAVFELSLTKFSTIKVSDISGYFVDTTLLGVSSLILIGIVIAFLRRVEGVIDKRLTVFLLVVVLTSIFFSTAYSAPFWAFLPSGFIQFPFRLLSVMMIGISFLAAITVTFLQKIKMLPFGLLLCVSLIYSAIPFFQPKEYFDKGEGFYATNEDSTTVKNEYMPRWVKEEPQEHPSSKLVVTNGTASGEQHATNRSTFTIVGKGNTEIQMNTIYYPGWKAFVNNKEVPITYENKKGLISFQVNASQADVIVRFFETPLRKFANTLSCVSLLLLMYYSFNKKNIKIKHKK